MDYRSLIQPTDALPESTQFTAQYAEETGRKIKELERQHKVQLKQQGIATRGQVRKMWPDYSVEYRRLLGGSASASASTYAASASASGGYRSGGGGDGDGGGGGGVGGGMGGGGEGDGLLMQDSPYSSDEEEEEREREKEREKEREREQREQEKREQRENGGRQVLGDKGAGAGAGARAARGTGAVGAGAGGLIPTFVHSHRAISESIFWRISLSKGFKVSDNGETVPMGPLGAEDSKLFFFGDKLFRLGFGFNAAADAFYLHISNAEAFGADVRIRCTFRVHEPVSEQVRFSQMADTDYLFPRDCVTVAGVDHFAGPEIESLTDHSGKLKISLLITSEIGTKGEMLGSKYA
ncbi:hypothetical protein B484DRAFT_416488 [Ochromonadaceae sp. CCMP2298]|nr:hypothetical protein B484DRAFT_416488 [Ochromonadaceae sp. CCMP2298]